jgi:hypothetical protein
MERVEKSRSGPPVGKFAYNDDMRKYYGKKRAEEIKKKDIETKRHKKAAALRKYAKLCKAEGIQSDRVHMGKKEDKDERPETEKPAKRPDFKPFQRAEKEAARLKQQEHEKEEHRLQMQREKEEALKKREEKRKALSKTTKRGQPVLGNHIKSILEKLQKNQ